MESKARLFLTEDKTQLVAEGDERGATLYAAPGDEIPEEAVTQFGLVDGDLPKAKPLTAKQLEKAEADKVAAEKAQADKVAAEKAAADAAAKKAEADKSSAEKAQGN